ncbi:hypothetical protein N752_15565 [Desulforamulus aquiferis]|nr:hypothetical protein [Desulforamulus aquiferis]RYD04260.1 hypothetical protein N752_15565 [Desulforamulus aquiferis]
MGLDREDDGTIVVIAQTVRPQQPGAGGVGGGGGGQDPKPFHNWYATGETVFDAVRNLSLLSPNIMFLPTTRSIFFQSVWPGAAF